MNPIDISTLLGNTDIYLIDQIMKGRYKKGELILDSGCGPGRNLHWFLINGFDIYGIDSNPVFITDILQKNKSLPPGRFQISVVEATLFGDNFFDHIISSAVLHFAKNTDHFFAMMNEMIRVLKPGGSLFIRMTSDIGIETIVKPIAEGIYLIPDGSRRFLLTRSLLSQILDQYPVSYLEEFKTVNVNDVRCMSTMVLSKSLK
jgi:ubiquinone/menaquinone biosynthesis C-methylase UbiE